MFKYISLILIPVSFYGQCDLYRKVDKFDGKIAIMGDVTNQISFHKFISNNDTSIHVQLRAVVLSPIINKTGVIILTENNGRIEDKTTILSTELIKGEYIVKGLIKIAPKDYQLFQKNKITDFRIYYNDLTIDPRLAEKYQKEFICVVEAK